MTASATKPEAEKKAEEPSLPEDGATVRFDTIFSSELKAINIRQGVLQKTYPALSPRISGDEPTSDRHRDVIDVVGLALSGGGIRSAAFCLGVLQALDAVLHVPAGTKKKPQPSLLQRVDYLSTVSGGGYIGCSMTAQMSNTDGKFPFASALDQDETDSIRHIRDYSNYLLPTGFLDLLDSIAIYLRGLLANMIIVFPMILALSILTILSSPTEEQLRHTKFYDFMIGLIPIAWLRDVIKCDSFGFTFIVFLLAFALFLLWGLKSVVERVVDLKVWGSLRDAWHGLSSPVRRFRVWETELLEQAFPMLKGGARWARIVRKILFLTKDASAPGLRGEKPKETGSRWARFGGYALFVLALAAFCELQPFVLRELFAFAKPPAGAVSATATPASGGLDFWLKVATAGLTAIGVIVSFLSDKLDKLTKNLTIATGWRAWIGRYSGHIVIYIAGIAMPLVVWWLYVMASFWGIRSNVFSAHNDFAAPDWLYQTSNAFFTFHPSAAGYPWLNWTLGLPVVAQLTGVIAWLAGVIAWAATWVKDHGSPIAGFYVAVAAVLFILSLVPTLNANSLHRLYRDRLSAAFIFFVKYRVSAFPQWLLRLLAAGKATLPAWVLAVSRPGGSAAKPASDPDEGLRLIDQFKLTQLSARFAPYHIINAALNIQGSRYANQRARNADFFMFSRNFVGSEATGYVATKQMELVARDLNLATAMAVSGAATSPNMGSGTIRSLTPTLTLLNVRLGYWLRNPGSAVGYNRLFAWFAETGNWYFFKEMFGQLSEKSHNVYLTDGGHIENLGVYELLKRRCKLIIAVDAEADPQMNFPSFVKLQRHARIDLGVRIDLPWQAIRNSALITSKKIADFDSSIPDRSSTGPHCALGVIRYPKQQIGYLLYIKSSLSGDENDYILDYKRRNPTFPHERTSDQLFTEEQFEVYRALGFHAAHGAVTGGDRISTLAKADQRPSLMKWNSRTRKNNPFPAVRAALGIKHP